MRRRKFIRLLGGIAAWPVTAGAQQARMPVIGVLGGPTRAAYATNLASFHQGLKEAGYVEGQNLAVEHRWAEGQYGRLLALAAELVKLRVAVIQTVGGAPAALPAKAKALGLTVPNTLLVSADELIE